MSSTDQQEHAEHRGCFGRMFPETLHFSRDERKAGKAFSFRVNSAGGTFVADREAMAEVAEWDDCKQCPEFTSCYQLSLGLLTLESVVASV